MAGNPLAAWEPRVHGHQLVLGRSSAKVTSLMVEPSWLGQVAQGQLESTDKAMVEMREKALGTDANFVVREVHGCSLVYRVGA